jgi:hypothetical protein
LPEAHPPAPHGELPPHELHPPFAQPSQLEHGLPQGLQPQPELMIGIATLYAL